MTVPDKYYGEQNLRLARMLMEKQGEINGAVAERDRLTEELSFVREVMSLFARADIRTEMFWNVYHDGIKLYANVSDVFTWGCADAEDITPERLPVLQQAYGDLAAIGGLEHLAELYGARIRRMRPQGAAYPDHPGVRALFDACGPERDLGFGNPKAPAPLAEPAQQGDTDGG